MITLLSILGILALLGIVATLAAVLNDGYRPLPTEWTRVRERGDAVAADTTPQELPPAPPETASSHPAGGVVSRRRTSRRTPRARLHTR